MRTQTTLLGALIVLVLTAAASANAPKPVASSTTHARSGLACYQAHHRSGTVLLRGALGTIGACVGGLLLELAGTRQVLETVPQTRADNPQGPLWHRPRRIDRQDEIGYPGRTPCPQPATSSRRSKTKSSRPWSAT